jgi:uncharacterized integral membrane protein (TIGR00698 family)
MSVQVTPSSFFEISDEALLSLGSMEGVYEAPVVSQPATGARQVAKAAPAESLVPAWITVGGIAALSFALHYLPFAPFQIASDHAARRPISASIIAILLGVLLRNLYTLPASVANGCKSIVKRVLPASIVLTGAGLNLVQMSSLGLTAFSITLVCIVCATLVAVYIGRLFGVWPKTALLIGAGTAICGTSAIVAVAPLIEAEDEDVTLSVATVNLLGMILMFLFPLAGGLLMLSDNAFGVWAGTSIHAVPQVVAAGFAFSERAGTLATLVKLVRVTLLAPFMLSLIFLYGRRKNDRTVTVHYSRLVPLFVWGFLALALANTLGLFPSLHFQTAPWTWFPPRHFEVAMSSALVEGSNILLTLAMAAMGLEVQLRMMAKVGGKALLTGTATAVILCALSLALIKLLIP